MASAAGADTHAGLSALLFERECDLLREEVRSSAERLEALLADDFREIGVSGRIWTRAAVIEALSCDSFRATTVEGFEVQRIAPDVALATYRAHRVASPEEAASASLRSSLWRRTDGTWRMVFHQGTPVASIR